MTLITWQDGTRFLASSAEIFDRYGVNLTVGTDFEEYNALLREARPDHPIGAPLDPKIHEMDDTNSFWIVGHNSAGEVMHTQAMRVLDLGTRSLGQYLRHSFTDFPPSGVDIDLRRSRFRAGPGAQRMFGRVAYHGEFWVGGAKGEYRGSGLSCILGRYGFMVGQQMFDPDYTFGFVEKTVVFKGFPARHGYLHMDPSALRWFIRGLAKPVEGYLVYNDREDLRFLLNLPVVDLVEMAA